MKTAPDRVRLQPLIPLLLALLLASGRLAAQTRWTVTNLHPGGSTDSSCVGISGNQQVGNAYFGGIYHASLWTGTSGSWDDLSLALTGPWGDTQANGIRADATGTPSIGSPPFEGDNLATVYYLAGTSGWGATFGGRPTVLWNPRILTGNGLFGIQAGHFGFTFMGAANIRVAIEASTDLKNWATIAHLICGGDGQVQFTEPQEADPPRRFYRVRPE